MSLRLVKSEESNYNSNAGGLLSGLNDMQAEAVRATEGPVLVIAGAGSGKTRVLTYRIAHLIERGVAPWHILALTFTNKAASEMKDRISRLVSEDRASRIWAGTFHSIFAKILRVEARYLGYTSAFSIYDSEDSLRVIKNIMVQSGFSQQDNSPQYIQNRISWAKNHMMPVEQFASSAQTPAEKISADVFREYEKQLRFNNAMDFDDLLINLIHLFQNEAEILAKYSERFRYILVDEYQDTNRAQYKAVKLLTQSNNNVCVVGDDAQSIYKWRGADIRNILEFQKDYPNAQLVRLEQNYRSTKVILSAAGSIIANNKRQIPKNLWTENPDGELIELTETGDDRLEADYISRKIRELKDYEFKDFAVLYRTNAQSLALENSFRRDDIPYYIVGGMSFYKRKEIKDALSYIRLLLNPQDTESLLRILNEPPRGIGNVSLGHIREFADKEGISLLEAFGRAEDIPNLMTKARKAAEGLFNTISKFSVQINENLNPLIIDEYINESGLPAMHKDINTEESLDRLNNIYQLLNDINYFLNNNPEANLVNYIEQISLSSEIDNADTSQNRVALMTVHSAKGLEFPVVFIAGLEQGLFPLKSSEATPDELEEERRLFYVAITRAMERLFLSHSYKRMRFGDFVHLPKSQFVDEIKEECIKQKETLKPQTKPDLTPKPARSTDNYSQISGYQDNYSQIEESEWDFRVGDVVRHNSFGKGRITGMSGSGDKRQAVVYFPSVGGKKQLMLKYAKLEKVKPDRS